MSDINIGAISEALNNKVDLPTPSTPQSAVDYVVEKQDPTADNNYTWYRKYKSGWVEQGGFLDELGVTNIFVIFPVVMANINYTVETSQYIDSPTGQYVFVRSEPETTQFSLKATATIRRAYWRVSGCAA